jgi:ketosteroid isomerase-like protein
MFITMRRYQSKSTDADEITRRVQTGLIPILSRQPGFHWYKAVDAGNDTIVSLSAYDSRSAAEAANQAAAGWVKENLGNLVGPADVTVGDVVLSSGPEQANVEAVQRGYEAFMRGDIAGVLNLLDPQIEWITPGPADLPTAGTRRGHAGVTEFFQSLNSLTDIRQFNIRELIGRGNTVVALGDSTEVVRATGNPVDTTFVHIFTMKDGKTIRFEERADFSALAEEFRSVRAAT